MESDEEDLDDLEALADNVDIGEEDLGILKMPLQGMASPPSRQLYSFV